MFASRITIQVFEVLITSMMHMHKIMYLDAIYLKQRSLTGSCFGLNCFVKISDTIRRQYNYLYSKSSMSSNTIYSSNDVKLEAIVQSIHDKPDSTE